MKIKLNRSNGFLAVLIACIMVATVLIPSTIAADTVTGYDKGPSYKPVVPLKKTTFVGFDEETYLDDYAYLAAVPTSVFDDGERLYSNPLLFYQDELVIEDDKELSLNAKEGIDYFMEDWMGYCNGKMDQLTLINVPKQKMDSSWKARQTTEIESESPYKIASELALSEWSYSDDAVVAVIGEDFEKPSEVFEGKLDGTVESGDINDEVSFEFPQTNKLNPQFKEFNVPDEYKYIQVRSWWASIDIHLKMFFSHIIIPTGDKDIQLYCQHNDEWMQVAAASTNNVQMGMDPDAERANSYVYEPGKWRVGLTDLPTKGVEGSFGEIFRNIRKGVTYNVDVKMLPGTEIEVPENPPYECSDIEFKLTWNNPNVNLGFSLIGPGGEEVKSVINESRDDSLELNLDELGQCLEGESYKICVFVTEDLVTPVDFQVEYSWKQKASKEKGDALTSATEGAVLASILNAPLLYTSKSELSQECKDALYKLGVENIHVIDLEERLTDEIIDEIDRIGEIQNHYTGLEEVYTAIQTKTENNDVVFSTIDPWTKWYVGELSPADETEAALFIGPAAYIAAHHGTPVLIVDNHPELSSAVVWHNEFWRESSNKRTKDMPSVSEMYLTGTRVYDFLIEHNFDREGAETLITVADQFDIGTSWDRVFPGRATPGRIWGTPVDIAQVISRNMFYPALIFENPAMDPSGVSLINGSKSERRFPFIGKLGLKVTRESSEEKYNYPILHTYVCYAHRLNEMFDKYYGETYQFANEIVPGETNSFNAIDDGVNLKYKGEAGSFYPDLIDSEITALYASRGGYGNAFSTSYDAVMYDLNQGSLMWIHDGHGLCADSGQGLFWAQMKGTGTMKEENPWRLYEWYLGSTENPDTMTMEVHGVLPAIFGNPTKDRVLRLGLAWAPARKPVLDFVADVLERPYLFPIVSYLAPDWLKDKEDYYDGMVNTVFPSTINSEFRTGYEMDQDLGNIHSCGYITANCLVSNTYYHLALIRHGSPYQIVDPWSTSWYSSAWIQSIPRDLALGHTIGEAYVHGIEDIGILYISEPPQWWWDIAENVVYFGDPDLRVFVPGTDYSDANYWEKDDVKSLRYDADTSVAGHMPFGADAYPNEKEELSIFQEYLGIIIAIVLIIVLLGIIVIITRRKK